MFGAGDALLKAFGHGGPSTASLAMVTPAQPLGQPFFCSSDGSREQK